MSELTKLAVILREVEEHIARQPYDTSIEVVLLNIAERIEAGEDDRG